MQYYQRKNRRFLNISGADAEKFLQNLLSQNLSELKQNQKQALLSCVLNQKGGVEAYFWIHFSDTGYVLDMHKSMLEDTMTILQRYVLRTKVAFEILPIYHSYFTLDPANFGENAQAHALEINGNTLYRHIFSDQQDIQSSDLSQYTEQDWDLYRIQNMWPKWLQDIDQGMLVLQSDFLKQGIAFDKGCYLGQETVARVHSRGERVAYKLVKLIAPMGSLALGDALYGQGSEKVLGTLSSLAQDHDEQKDWALALLHRNGLQEQFLQSNKGIKVEVII